MPVYVFICPSCQTTREEVMGVHEPHVAECECGMGMDRYWQAENVSISGDTCAHCCNEAGYDESLGTYIRSRSHRKEEMKRRGLEPYVPDPEQKAFRKEMLYMQKHGKGDAKLGEAIVEKKKESGRARMKQAIREVNSKKD